MVTLKTEQLYDLSHTIARELLLGCDYPWQALPRLREFLFSLGRTLPAEEYVSPSDGVWIAKDATVAESVTILPPSIVGHRSELRTGAYLRGAVLVGEGCVVGNSCELKNAILFDGAQVPHFNYVGDSILGSRTHLGAGAITSNVKSDKTPVAIRTPDGVIETGMKKLGACLGDFVEIGCNTVLNPGTVIGKHTTVYPLSSVRGVIPPKRIFKGKSEIAIKETKETNERN